MNSFKSNWIIKSLTTWLICTNCDVNIWCGFLLPAKRRCRLRISLRNPFWGKLTRSSTKANANCLVVIGGFGRPRTRFPNCSQTCSIGFMSALHAGQSILRILLCIVNNYNEEILPIL
jgi:hypothetical protein